MAELDPLKDPALKGPGILESLRRGFLGKRRELDCIQLEVTSVCAGRCTYCPHTTMSESWHSRHMSDAVYASLWPLILASERVHLQGWGEPLLHPRFFDFVALARRADCQVSSTTCGLKMDADIARRLARCGMDMLAFSLVGTDAASNDSGRVGVPFERVYAAIRMVRNAVRDEGYSALDVHLAYLLLADRVEAVAALPRLMEELDVSTAVVSSLDYIADEDHSPLAFAPHERQKIARARQVLQTAAQDAAASGRSIVFALPGPRAVADAGGCRENVRRSLYVDAEGALSPCVYLNVPDGVENPRRRIFGNALANNPLEVWRQANFAAFREGLVCNRPDRACLVCPKRFELVGGGSRD